MPTPTPLRRASRCLPAAALALSLTQAPAHAGPVVQPGSNWSLSILRDGDFGNAVHHVATFDGLAETFAFSADGQMNLTVEEAQTDLGAGRSAIELTLRFAGGDPTAANTPVIFGVGVNGVRDGFAGTPLQLSEPVALTAARLSGLASAGAVTPADLMWDYRYYGLDSNWTGALFASNIWLGVGNASDIGLRVLTLRFETQALGTVSSPGTLPLLGLGLGLVLVLGRLRPRAGAAGRSSAPASGSVAA